MNPADVVKYLGDAVGIVQLIAALIGNDIATAKAKITALADSIPNMNAEVKALLDDEAFVSVLVEVLLLIVKYAQTVKA
jgi:hypothetical protein